MEKRKLLRFFVLPALAGLLAVGIASLFLAPRDRSAAPGGKPAAVKEEMVAVVLAKRQIPARTKLKAEDLTVKDMPRQYAWKGALTDVGQAVDKVTVAALAEGEPVLASALALPENKAGLAFHVPTGHRAMTLSVGDLSGLSGRLQVGDRVDVLLYLADPKPAKAVLLMENVAILALGRATGGAASQDTPGKSTGAGAADYATITVAVKPEQALTLALAEKKDELRFILRPAAPEGERGRLRVTEDQLQ